MTEPISVTPHKTPKRAAVSSLLGSTVEYYDFFIYGTAAALGFNKIFFPQQDPTVGLLLSLATFGVAYVTRPIGALVLGHFGDRIGRQKIMVLTLVLMGTATFGIGILPGYDSIGIAAPILLVTFRLLQGFSAAGEQSGAGALTLEHAPDHRRSFYTSWMLVGNQNGVVLSTLVFIPIAALPEEELLAWGWRVPFLIGIVPLVVAYIVRRKLKDAPVFAEIEEAGETARLPIRDLLADHWRDVVRVIFCAIVSMVNTTATVFGLAYATSHGVDRQIMLWAVVFGAVCSLVTIPLYGHLADRIGRKPVFIGGALACAVVIYPYFLAVTSGNTLLVFLGSILLTAVAYSATNAVYTAFYSEMFTAKVRYSGVAIGTQLGFLAMGFTPAVGTALQGSGTYGWVPVAAFVSVCCVIAAFSASTAHETYRVRTQDLGRARRERSNMAADDGAASEELGMR